MKTHAGCLVLISGMRNRRKVLGQHFLNSTTFAKRIALTAGVRDKLVVEIGSGKGILTRQLAGQAERVIAVEIDSRLANHLKNLKMQRVDVQNRDFLGIDLETFSGSIVVGNIPYNITSAILAKLIENKAYTERAVLTVQKEYGDRMMASLGSRDYGYTSIYMHYHFNLHKEFIIPARYFSPKPKVSSVVITLQPREGSLDAEYEARFFEFISGVFRYRRKIVRNAILSHLRWMPHDISDGMLEKRPQHLSIDDFLKIYQKIFGK
jgi:16S rRNA (adenine1518-N6/adenine1519-N6)-dimethyltransferase